MPKLTGVPPRRDDEQAYYREMNRRYLRPFLAGLAAELRSLDKDVPTTTWLAVVGAYATKWAHGRPGEFPRAAIEAWATRLNGHHAHQFARGFWRAARVDIRHVFDDLEMQSILHKAVDESVSLIKTIPERFHDDLVTNVTRAERLSPVDLKDRESIYRKTGKSSGYNLRRITRDQSNKLTGALSEFRQTQVGVTKYKWETAADDRVRPNHESKDGRVFSWDQAPFDTGHPGHDIQCRCVAVPEISIEQIQRQFGGA